MTTDFSGIRNYFFHLRNKRAGINREEGELDLLGARNTLGT